MKSSNYLYELVLKLNRQEKRFISIYLSKKNYRSNHIDFFKLLVKLKSNDESYIKKKLANTIILKNLAIEKNLLYNLILRALNDFHQEYDARTQISDLLKQVNILFNKSLYLQAQKRLSKAKKIAQKHDFIDLIYSIIDYERKILFKLKLHTLESNIQQITELNKATKKLNNLIYYKDIEGQVFYHRLKHDTNAASLVLTNPFLNDYDKTQSIESKIIFNHCILLCNQSNPNFDITENSENLLNIFLNNQALLIDQFNRFVVFSSNRIRALMNFDKTETAKIELNKFKIFGEKIIPKIRLEQQIFFRHILLSNQMFLFFRCKQYDKVIALKEELINTTYKNEKNLSPIACISCYGVIGTSAFHLQKDKEAIFWFDHILKNFTHLPNLPHRKVVSFIVILCHFNLGNIAIVPHLTKAFRRKFLKETEVNTVEKKIIRFLEYDVSKTTKKSDLQEKMEVLHQTVLDYSENQTGDLSWITYANIWLKKIHS